MTIRHQTDDNNCFLDFSNSECTMLLPSREGKCITLRIVWPMTHMKYVASVLFPPKFARFSHTIRLVWTKTHMKYDRITPSSLTATKFRFRDFSVCRVRGERVGVRVCVSLVGPNLRLKTEVKLRLKAAVICFLKYASRYRY
jgi:hypothetical protein